MSERKNNSSEKDFRDRDLYRRAVRADDLVAFEVRIKETDLMVLAERDLGAEAREIVLTHRFRLEEYIARSPDFRESLEPLRVEKSAPGIVRLMAEAGRTAGVGPMAAVAGAIAELVGEELRNHSGEVLVENGGDLYLAGKRERVVGLYTAERGLGARLGLRYPGGRPLGICTSSGRFGHSLSFGEASTATVTAPSAALADAAATAVGNSVQGSGGIDRGMERAMKIAGVTGAVIVHGGRFGAWGDVEIVHLDKDGGAV